MSRLVLLPLILLFAVLQSACTAPTRVDNDPASVETAVSRQAAVSDDRQRAKAHAELGRLYMLDGRYEVALEEARIAIEAEPAYAPAHNLRALVYMALRKNDLSENSFREALRLAPNDPEINNDFGWFLCQSGKAAQSISHFKVAIGNPLFQDPGKALTNAGLCSLVAKDDRQAEEYLARALRVDRTNLSALYWLADIAYRDNRLMDARQRLKDMHALIADPSAASAWLALRIERKLGDRENEARYMGLLRRKYRDSAEYLKMSRGEFD